MVVRRFIGKVVDHYVVAVSLYRHMTDIVAQATG